MRVILYISCMLVFAFGQLGFLTVVVLFCRFVDCVSLALKSPYWEWSINYVLQSEFQSSAVKPKPK